MERYIHIDTGMAVTAPDGTALPSPGYYACGSADVDALARGQLAQAAGKLGIEVPSKASKARIAELIDKRAAELFWADEARNAGRPQKVAPKRAAGGEPEGAEDDV